jgi:hypothetical protein
VAPEAAGGDADMRRKLFPGLAKPNQDPKKMVYIYIYIYIWAASVQQRGNE